MLTLVIGDIATATSDVIVNASNGVGYMGGFIGKYVKCSGVAETIHYMTKGQVEKECKNKIGKNNILSTWLMPAPVGSVIITNGFNLKCKFIFHAVTMLYPGTRSSYSKIVSLLDNIIFNARQLGINSLSIPLLGTGVGKLEPKIILNLYKKYFRNIEDIDIQVYMLNEIN